MRAEGRALSHQREDASRRLATPLLRNQSPESRSGVGSDHANSVWRRRVGPSRSVQTHLEAEGLPTGPGTWNRRPDRRNVGRVD